LTKQALLAAREVRYRHRMTLRITTTAHAVDFVNDVGFCFLFPIQKVETPSLWDAIAGRVVKTYPDHSGYEVERTWGWKDKSLDWDWLQFKGRQPFADFSRWRRGSNSARCVSACSSSPTRIRSGYVIASSNHDQAT
jgi:hypothetical protein